MNFYQNFDRILLAVDCIIFGFDNTKIKLLIFKKEHDPSKGHWSLLGTIVQKEENTLEAASRILKESAGLSNIFLEEFKVYSDVNRDPGARIVSVAHYALIRIDEYNSSLVESSNSKWVDFENLPPLIFDHEQMVSDALEKLRRKARYRPIGFELLPEKFTIPQLKKLYDAIYQKELDRRNFRKKILSMKILEKLNEKDKSSSRKGAYLYRFNPDKYELLLQEGINFQL